MIEFRDILYGKIHLPDWIEPFLKMPEFARLRGVRLSNVDSYEFKDFSGPRRWEHSIAVAYLSLICAKTKGLNLRDTVHLMLGGLLHDIATPPMGHTLEYVLPDFDHELESMKLLLAVQGNEFQPDTPIYVSQLPRFRATCHAVSRSLQIKIDPDKIADIVVGKGEFGYLVKGTLDLDNVDNVTRACRYLGIEVESEAPIHIAEWLGKQTNMPVDISNHTDDNIKKWVKYRKELYSAFYCSSEAEISRQAFLQHILRRALYAKFPRKRLVWNTDETLLFELEKFAFKDNSEWAYTLSELIQRYTLLDQPMGFAKVYIDNFESLRTLMHPEAASWIEKTLSTTHTEVCVFLAIRRHASTDSELFPSLGTYYFFIIGGTQKVKNFKKENVLLIENKEENKKYNKKASAALNHKLQEWIENKPWLQISPVRQERIKESLDYIGDWGFRLCQNDNIHSYPGTFVYAIPASLITALGLKGELILDPFGGTGQTAIEAIKYGGSAISSDINSIACMIVKAKSTFLDSKTREMLRMLDEDELRNRTPANIPIVENINKWFHPETLNELCKIWNYIAHKKREPAKNFLKVCFSAVLPSCTGRRGKQNSWFADNTPLPKGVSTPQYQDAISQFINRISMNLLSLEDLYAYFQREGRDPQKELARVSVLKVDASQATPKMYGVEPRSIAGIITSPPYLCMADYTLGQRLSYYWMFSDELQNDFGMEIGARRRRSYKGDQLNDYLSSIERFAENMSVLTRDGGFLATILGEPVAKAFEGSKIIQAYDELLSKAGFELIWSRNRNIHWHRHHGYEKIKNERISVHVLQQ